MSLNDNIIKKKRILRENGYNVVLDNSWGPSLLHMWEELSKRLAELALLYYVGEPIYVLERHDELRPGLDDANRSKILSDAALKARENPDEANAIMAEAELEFNKSGLEKGHETKWYNPLTWGMDYATNIVGLIPFSERGEYLKEHPWIAKRYNDAERYRQGHDIANGAELLGNTALLAGSTSAGFGLRGINGVEAGSSAIGTGARLLKSGWNAVGKSLGTQWKLARSMPWRYAFNAAKDFLVVPTLAGGAINWGTKFATDKATGGYGTTFDEGISLTLGVPEIIGSTLNPGYSFKVFLPKWKLLWRAGYVDDIYMLNLKNRSNRFKPLFYTDSPSVPVSEMRDAARLVIDDVKKHPEYPILVNNNKLIFVPSDDIIDRQIDVRSPFNHSNTSTFRVYGQSGTKYSYGKTYVDANGVQSNPIGNVTSVLAEKSNITIPIQVTPYDAITRDYNKFAEDISHAVGDDGLLSGSVLLFADGWFPGSFDGTGFNPAHDIEFLTTEARLPALKKKLGIGELISSMNFVRSGRSSRFPQLSNGDTDILLILEKDGKAVGKVAHEVYAYLHPDEYARMHNQYTIANKNAVPSIKWEDTELPISAEDLYTELRNSGLNGLRILMDMLGSQKDKHINRAKALITNPEKLHLAMYSYDRLISSIIEGYLDPLSIYKNFNFDDIESNKLLILVVTNLPEQDALKLATNKLYVQDLFKMFINNKTIGFRRSGIPQKGDVITGLTHGAAGYGNDLSSGPGLNMLRVAPIGRYYGDFISVLQNKLTYNPEKITNTLELLLLLLHLGERVPELYYDKSKGTLAQEATRISLLAKQRDLPIYLAPDHNDSGMYLGMVHDLDVPHGLYVNSDNVEVPGGAVIESLRSFTNGTGDIVIMSQKEYIDYLKRLRQDRLDRLTGKVQSGKSISLSDLGNMFPTSLVAKNTSNLQYGVSFYNISSNNAKKSLSRSAKILKDVNIGNLYGKADDVPSLASLTDAEIEQLEALRRAATRRKVSDILDPDEASRLYDILKIRRDYPYITPLKDLFKRDFRWAPGMGIGVLIPINFLINTENNDKKTN